MVVIDADRKNNRKNKRYLDELLLAGRQDKIVHGNGTFLLLPELAQSAGIFVSKVRVFNTVSDDGSLPEEQ